jgi:hypothetical protein
MLLRHWPRRPLPSRLAVVCRCTGAFRAYRSRCTRRLGRRTRTTPYPANSRRRYRIEGSFLRIASPRAHKSPCTLSRCTRSCKASACPRRHDRCRSTPGPTRTSSCRACTCRCTRRSCKGMDTLLPIATYRPHCIPEARAPCSPCCPERTANLVTRHRPRPRRVAVRHRAGSTPRRIPARNCLESSCNPTPPRAPEKRRWCRRLEVARRPCLPSGSVSNDPCR